MALSSADHLKRAKYNEDFANFLNGKWPAWIVTARFYAALHYAQALLVSNGQRPGDHKARNKALFAWPDIRRPYMRLYQWAHDARYQCQDPDAKTLGYAEAALDSVKAEVSQLLGVTLP